MVSKQYCARKNFWNKILMLKSISTQVARKGYVAFFNCSYRSEHYITHSVDLLPALWQQLQWSMCTATTPDVNCVYIQKCVWKEVKVKCLLSASITSTIISEKALNYTVRANSGIFFIVEEFFIWTNSIVVNVIRACVSTVCAGCGSAGAWGERKGGGRGWRHGKRAAWSAWECRREHDVRVLSVSIAVMPNSIASLC